MAVRERKVGTVAEPVDEASFFATQAAISAV
jgi:hypothetical protein